MKRTFIIKEANVGSKIEISNIELTLIKTKWEKISENLSKGKRVTDDLQKDIKHFTNLVNNLCGECISLENIAHHLFKDELSDEEIERSIEASTSSYSHEDIYSGDADDERAHRRIDKETI
jgi:hypothetical protein